MLSQENQETIESKDVPQGTDLEYQEHYTISKGKYNFVIRPEEKSGLRKRLKEDDVLKNTVFNKMNNDQIFASIEYSITKQSNAIVDCFGIPESGKSTVLKIIGYYLYQKILKFKKDPVLKITFNYPETIHEIRKFFQIEHGLDEKILIVQQDEQNDLSGPESRAYRTQINNLIKTFRAAQVFVLLASPDDQDLAVSNMKIEAIAKDPELRVNWAINYVPKRKDTKKVEFVPAGSIFLEYTEEIEQFYSEIIDYEKKKMEYILEIIANRGLQTVILPDEVKEELIQKVVTEAKRRRLQTKEGVKILAKNMGIGTSNTAKFIGELAALEFDAFLERERERRLIEETRLLEKKQEEEQKRINKLVIQVARELFDKFDFVNERKSFSRLTKGYIIENYEDDWHELLKHHSNMFSLAHFWQEEQHIPSSVKMQNEENPIYSRDTTSRLILRKALENAILPRYNDHLLALRASYNFIPDEKYSQSSWSIQKAAQSMSDNGHDMKYGTLRKYFYDRSDDIGKIESNRKIWGDAGELYFTYMCRQVVKKGKTEGWISEEATIDLLCAAERRSDDESGNSSGRTASKTTSLYDIEVIIDGRSVAAVNAKFTYVSDQGYKMEPECGHDWPYLFVIDKNDLTEILVPSERGKSIFTGLLGGQSSALSIEEFVRNCIETSKS